MASCDTIELIKSPDLSHKEGTHRKSNTNGKNPKPTTNNEQLEEMTANK